MIVCLVHADAGDMERCRQKPALAERWKDHAVAEKERCRAKDALAESTPKAMAITNILIHMLMCILILTR